MAFILAILGLFKKKRLRKLSIMRKICPKKRKNLLSQDKNRDASGIGSSFLPIVRILNVFGNDRWVFPGPEWNGPGARCNIRAGFYFKNPNHHDPNRLLTKEPLLLDTAFFHFI
jgi:hypothetical protein